MFDLDCLPSVAAVTSVDAAGLIDAIGAAARLEAATMARRLAAIAQLHRLRSVAPGSDERDRWSVDTWDCVCAEIAAAQGISRHRAAHLLDTALVLCEDLPTVAAVFAEGRVDYRVIAAVVSRTKLVKDEEDIARVDAVDRPATAVLEQAVDEETRRQDRLGSHRRRPAGQKRRAQRR